jgi:uncharacterized protein
MSISLHTAVVGTFQQQLPSLLTQIDKAIAYCAEMGLPETALTEARLIEDMWPYAKQVTLSAVHSHGAILAVRAGLMNPDRSDPPTDFASLRTRIAQAIDFMPTIDPGELDAIANRDMRFEFGERRMDFTVSDFLMSFSLPNFYFHSTSAYAILRKEGVAVGKFDFLGRPRLKQAED